MAMVKRILDLKNILDNNSIINFSPKFWYEDIDIGYELETEKKIASTQQLVMYAGASGDYVPIHYDSEVAKNAGHEKVIIHGALKMAWLSNFLTEWAGINSILSELEVQYRSIDYPGEELFCEGKVVDKNIENNSGIISLEISLKKVDGTISVIGNAKIVMALKK